MITKGSTPKNFTTDGINFIKIESISDLSNINLTKLAHISFAEHTGYLKRSILMENDILFSIAGALGNVYVVDKKILPANTNQALAIIRLKKQEYVNYISYYLQSKIIKNMINGSKSIGAQPNLSLAQISNIEVKLPTNDDLRNIKFLKLIDNRITAQKKIIEDCFSIEKSIINKMRTECREIRGKQLTEYAYYYNGVAHENNICDNGYTLINSKYISSNGEVAKFCDEQKFPLIKGDICIVLSDLPSGKALGKCCYISEDNKYTLNQRIACIRSINMNLSKYLFYYLNRNSYFLKFDDGVNQTNLSKKNICDFIIKIHPENEKYVKLLDMIKFKIKK